MAAAVLAANMNSLAAPPSCPNLLQVQKMEPLKLTPVLVEGVFDWANTVLPGTGQVVSFFPGGGATLWQQMCDKSGFAPVFK